jgi:hypothetical protein
MNVKRALLVAFIMILFPAPAHASCVQPPPLERAIAEADVAFVGTVETISNRGRDATVAVESLWKGPDLPAEVEVFGGPRRENIALSNERHFEDGTRYLFIPTNRRPPFKDNACTQTQQYRSALDRFAPEQADADVPFDDFDDSPHWLTIVLSILAVSAAAFLALRAFRR